MLRRDEFCPGLVDTDIRNLLSHTETIEDRKDMRHKRFADVKPGMPGLVDQHDPPAVPGEETRCGRPGRAAADDGDIEFIVIGNGEPRNFQYLRDTDRAATSSFQSRQRRGLGSSGS